MTARPSRLLPVLLLPVLSLPVLLPATSPAVAKTRHASATPTAAARSPAPAATPASGPAASAPAAKPTPAWPSFLTTGEVLCLDELDFNAYARTGRFHTRGSQESCTRVTELTRVAVLNQSGRKSQVRVVSGPLESNVGWTDGALPLAGPKPGQ